MNQKGFANIILVVVIVILIGVASYFAFVKKSEPITQQQTPTPISNTIKITDKGSLYSVEIPKDWKVTESIGARGVSLSSIHIESSDWKAHSVAGGPHDNIYYETGASLGIGVDTLNEDPLAYSDIISKKNIVIGGVNGIYYVFKEPSLSEGRLLGAYVYYKGNRYTFRLGYNPNAYSQGETVFTNILNSFKFTK